MSLRQSNDDELEHSDEFISIIDSIDTYVQPTAYGNVRSKEHDKLLLNAFSSIESCIDGLLGDPGKLYPLHERVRRVVDALQTRVK